jgi:hypothetical protein
MGEQTTNGGATRKILVAFMNGAVGVGGLTAIAAGLYFLLRGETSQAVAGVGCGVVQLLLATVDRFEVIKGIGIEAKTRDLRREIDHADQILAQIKEITVAITPSLLRLAANAGRFDGSEPPELVYKLARTSDKLLTAAGVDRHAVRAALAPWARVSAMDLTRAVFKPLEEDARRAQRERQAVVDGWTKPVDAADPGFVAAIEAAGAVSPWVSRGRDAHLWSPSQCAIELRRAAQTLPEFIAPEVAKKFREDVDVWAAELEFLAERDDFRDASMWFARMRSSEDGYVATGRAWT